MTVEELTSKERMIAARLLEEYPKPLPSNIAKLVRFAPDCFADKLCGIVVQALREVHLDGKPVLQKTVLAWLKKSNTRSTVSAITLKELVAFDAVSIDLAELEAVDVWQAYEDRRVQSVLSDAVEACVANPTKAALIGQNVTRTLSDLSRNNGDTAHKLTIRKPDEILELTFDDSDQILGDRLLATGQYLVIAGAGETGKSRMLLQLAVCIITARPFLRFETRGENRRLLILQAENSNRRLQHDLSHLRDWINDEAAWKKVNEQLIIHTIETDEDGFLNLDASETVRRIDELIEQTKPDIIGFDSLYNFGDGDLNSDVDMRRTLTALSRITRRNNPERACVVLHHAQTGKAGAARAIGYDRSSFGRNSKVLHAWTRGQINVAPGSKEDNEVLIIACGKSSNGKPFEPFAIRLNQQTMIYEIEDDFDLKAWESVVRGKKTSEPLVSVEMVADLYKGEMTNTELIKAIMDETGCSKSLAYRKVKEAQEKKRIHKTPTNGKFIQR